MSGFCARASVLSGQVARRARSAIGGWDGRAERTYSRRASRTQVSYGAPAWIRRTLSGCKAYPKHAASSALSDRSCSRYLG